MSNKRWERRAELSNAPPIETWPMVDTSVFPTSTEERYTRSETAIRMYVAGNSLKEISKATTLHATQVYKLIKRALEMAPDGRIYGFRAAIPYIRTSEYIRQKDDKDHIRGTHGGLSGMLNRTLNRFPDLDKRLVALIRKDHQFRRVHEKRISPSSLHRIFLNQLRKLGVTDNEWPFNTKELGAKSILKFMNSIISAHFSSSVSKREESSAKAHLSVGTGHEPLLCFSEPFEVVELDAYDINAFFSVSFTTPEGAAVAVALERIWFLALIERISTAVLGYSVVYKPEVSSDDILSLIRNTIMNSWVPKELTIKGLKYPRNGGLPSGVIPQCRGAVWSALFVDNALANMADSIAKLERKDVGNVLNWGPVHHFERRPGIERLFGQISNDVFKRLPSTTGSDPKSGRAPDAQEASVKYNINADESDQYLDVVICTHNATPTEGLSFLSPVEYLEQYFDHYKDHFIVRKLPSSLGHGRLLNKRFSGTIRGSISNGRRPYLQFLRAHYTSPAVSQTPALIGTDVTCEIIDADDIRQLRAYLPNGAELGVIRATGMWSKRKHSLRTRKAIIGLINKRILVLSETDDPIEAYMEHLSTPKSKKGTISPSSATEANRLSKETGIPLSINEPDKDVRHNSQMNANEDDVNCLGFMKPASFDLGRVINRSPKRK